MILSAFVYIAFAALLVGAAVVDMRTLIIPNRLIVGLAALWLAWRVALGVGGALVGADFFTAFLAPAPFKGVSAASGIIGSVMLGGGLLVVTAAYEALSKKRAMGGGDIKLLAMVGLFLGPERGVICLLVACFASLMFALVLPRMRWGGKSVTVEAGHPILKEIPFGPSIAIGSAAALVLF